MIGPYQFVLWWAFRIGPEEVPRAFQSLYYWFFWLGPLEIRKMNRASLGKDKSCECGMSSEGRCPVCQQVAR